MNPLNPKKLRLTKWTAVKPIAKQKHFLVSRIIEPEQPSDPIELVEIEAVFSKTTRITLMASSNSPTRGHPKFPQAARSDYDGSALIAMRAAASLSL